MVNAVNFDFTEYEKSGAVWIFKLPEWRDEECLFLSKRIFTHNEALREFAERYVDKRGTRVIEVFPINGIMERKTIIYKGY